VIELHGHGDGVQCMTCSHLHSRSALQQVFLTMNPSFEPKKVQFVPSALNPRPDGDVELGNFEYPTS
jgi:hypothetical protein